MKLRFKILLFASSLLLAVIVLVSVFIYWGERRFIIQNAYQEQETIEQGLMQLVRESMLLRDDLLLLKYIRFSLERYPGIVYIAIIDKEKNIIAHSDPDYWKKKYEPKMSGLWKKGQQVRVVRQPIYLGNVLRGEQEIGFSLAYLGQQINRQLMPIFRRIVLAALIAFGLGLAGAFFLANQIVRPIMKLAGAAELIGQGKLDTRISVVGKDELAFLSKEFNRMAEQLNELEKMKEDFVSSVTHELRSPLGAIETYLNLMLERPEELSEHGYEYLIRLKNNTARLANFINDLLDVSRIERGGLVIRRNYFAITPMLEDVLRFFRVPAEKKGIQLISQIAPDLPQIYGDVERLRQVVVNLISNALKFSPENSVIILGAGTSGENLLVWVKDSGPGVPPEHQGKIFDKFYQVVGPDTSIQKGTGLGLAIARGIVESHGGKIWIESPPKDQTTGSCFYFSLSLNPAGI